MLTIILSVLLAVSTSACNNASNDNIPEDGSVPANSYAEAEVDSEADLDANIQTVAEGSISCNGNDNTEITYKINQGGEVTLHIDEWNEDHLVSTISLSSDAEIEVFRHIPKAIAINNERACLFLQQSGKITIVGFEKRSPSETVTSLELSEPVIGIEGNFINENIGYLFAFKEVSEGHARGGSKLSSFFITEDGGNTWNLIDVQNVPSISLQEYIMYAHMASKEVGLISGNFFAADYDFCDRTLLTIDGGINWVHVADLSQINDLQWAIVTDFTRVDDAYVLTLRYTMQEASGEYGYAEYKLINLNTWIRIK